MIDIEDGEKRYEIFFFRYNMVIVLMNLKVMFICLRFG